MTLPRVRRGEPVSADLFNRLLEMVEAGTTIKAGQGLDVTVSNGKTTITLAKLLGEDVRLARVVARTGDDTDLARNIRYDVQELGTLNVMRGVVPTWGRPTRRGDIEIEAAPVGALCFIVREPVGGNVTVGRLLMPAGGDYGESLAFAECEAETGPPIGAVMQRVGDGGSVMPGRDDGDDEDDGGTDTIIGGGTPSPTPPPGGGEA